MPLNDFFSPPALAREINQGESAVRFWLNRFSPWFPHTVDRGQKRYPRQSIATLLLIAEKIDDGMIPSQIETFLEENALAAGKEAETSNRKHKIDETVSKGLDMIQSLLGTMATLQERTATAQERRAGAEEQKARALERRAAAEEQKALAMNAIAAALNGMNQGIPGQVRPEGTGFETNRASSPKPGPEMKIEPGPDDTPENPVDELGLLVDDPPEASLDDLSLLVDDTPEASLDDLSLLVDDTPEASLDDLSLLVDVTPEASLDDLNLLVDAPPEASLDDLSLLVDDTPEASLDDLSLLVDDTPEASLDDLSLLVDDTPEASLDDLSLLVDVSPEESLEKGYAGLDDLGMLVKEETACIKPQITPDENFESYKSEIINIIIQLKNQGLSVEETTDRFNDDGVLTLSGKPRWSAKAIEQIYRFIDAVKK